MAGKRNRRVAEAQTQAELPSGSQDEVKLQVESVEPRPEPEPPRDVVRVRAVRGRMVNPYGSVEITQEPIEVEGEIREGSWLDCQIKAGKIQIV